MSSLSGCQPSSLIQAIHYHLPYFTRSPFEGNTSNITLDNVVDDVLRAGGWAAIILCIALALSIGTCFYCCCMCCVCCIKGREKPLVLKVLLGVVTGAILLTGVIFMFVSFWSESSLHNSIAGEATNIVNFTGYYVDPLSSEIVKTVVLFIETKRHSVFIGYLVILFLFLLTVLAVIALAPFCKTGVGVIVAVVVMGFFTVFNSILVASVFAVIVVYSDVCIGLFSLDLGIDICSVPEATPSDITQLITDWVSYLDVFCNKSVNYAFILCIMSAILVVLFILIQIFGFAYGASFFGRKPDTVSVRASEVWNVDAMDDSEPTVNVTTYQPSYTSEDEVPLMSVVD